MAQEQPEDSSRQPRLEQVLADYLRSEEEGQPVDSTQLLAEHPDLADELASFFRNRSAMQRLAEQVQTYELPTLDVQGTGGPPGVGAMVRYFGDYELLEEIARGGMGVVYKAKQKSLNRIVALKMILAGSRASAVDLARFRTEAEAAARLDHPHIVPVYEVGEHEGLNYYTMKWVEGGDLTTHLPQLLREPKQAVKLVETIARAVHFAHQHGILHRDLKPANILLDGDKQPQVTDFGLARLTDTEGKLTQTGAALGTPGYMAPEQIRGDKLVTTATDVYSLGAILFACLTGRSPFGGSNAMEAMLKALDSDAPSPRSLNAKVHRDLETICRKALERDPARRYGSAGALADDLGRWLRHEPIEARPAGAVERAIKWVRRHPGWTAATLLAGAALLVMAVQWRITTVAFDQASKSLYRTRIALAEREWSAGDMFSARKALLACPPEQRGWEWGYARRLCYITPGHRPEGFGRPLVDGCFSADGTRFGAVDAFGNARIWDTATRREVAQIHLVASDDPSRPKWWYEDSNRPTILLSPDGERVALAGGDTVHCFDVETKEEAWKWEAVNRVTLVGIQAGGNLIAASVRHSDETPGAVVCLTTEAGEVAHRMEKHVGGAFLDDGRLLAHPILDYVSTDSPKPTTLLDTRTGEQLVQSIPYLRMEGFPLAMSSDGNYTVYHQKGGNSHLTVVRLRDGESKQIPVSLAEVRTAIFSPDARLIAFVSEAPNIDVDEAEKVEPLSWFGGLLVMLSKSQPYLRNVHIVDVKTGKEVALLQGWSGMYCKLCFSPDGQTLFAYGGSWQDDHDKTPVFSQAILWNVKGQETARILRGAGAINDLAITSDGKRIVTASDQGVCVWEASSGTLVREFKHETPVRRREIRSDADPRVVRYEVLETRNDAVKSVAVGQDANLVLSADAARAILWNCENGKVQETIPHWAGQWPSDHNFETYSILTAVLRPDGKQVAFSASGRAVVLERGTGQTEFEIKDDDLSPQFISYSPDGRLLAVPYQHELYGKLKIVDTATGRVRWERKTEMKAALFRLGWGYLRAAFSADGRYVAVVGNVGGAHLYDLRSGRLVRRMEGHGTTVWDVAFTSDSKRLATAGYSDHTVKLWSVATGEEVHTLRGHDAEITCLAFSPDDAFLASGDKNGVVRIWEAR